MIDDFIMIKLRIEKGYNEYDYIDIMANEILLIEDINNIIIYRTPYLSIN